MRCIGLAIAALAALVLLAAPVQAADERTYALTAEALLGDGGVDLYLRVSSDDGAAPDRLEKVQVKALPFGNEPLTTRNYFDLRAVDGLAVLRLEPLARHRPLGVRVHVKDGNQNNLEAKTRVLLRPNLAVEDVAAPADVLRGSKLTVDATVAERAGDVGATAVATLYDGTAAVAAKEVSLEAGGTVRISFELVLTGVGRHDLRVAITESEPAEAVVADNEAGTSVEVHRYTADGVVSTYNAAATAAGVRILRAGGNAFDAAAAVQFSLNVVEPSLTGIGGGTDVVVRLASGETYGINGREVAPEATGPFTYAGQTRLAIGMQGYSVGVPTTLATIKKMLDEWGTMSLAETLVPAIELAEAPIPASRFLRMASGEARTLDLQPETIARFRRPDGSPLQVGDVVVQPDLAHTFRLIAEQGADTFYRGEIARAIVDAQRRLSPTKPVPGGEGRMTLADLADVEVEPREPLSLDYRGYEVVGARPPTNGGQVVLETLGLVERFPLGDAVSGFGFGRASTLHVTLEAMRLAFADRNLWIGDEDAVDVPVHGLLSPGYLGVRGAPIGVATRIPEPTPPGDPRPHSGTALPAEFDGEPADGHTSHFSIVDKWGNVVSMTSTLADSFGSGIMVPGYGFVLNDSLSLFNPSPLRNGDTGNPGANDAGPSKRPMGSMAPTMVLKDQEPVLVTGTYGGNFIPSLVVNAVLNVVDHGMTLRQTVDATRMWGTDPNGTATWGGPVEFAQQEIDAMRALGDRITRRPDRNWWFGQLATAGVDLATLDLIGIADTPRLWEDASAEVMPW
jgi:gamma-glutamyltranspeptidase/glutathione hydrolase